MNKLLVTTYYKNNYMLLSLFYKFYKKYWTLSSGETPDFLFCMGNTDSTYDNNIFLINNILGLDLKKVEALSNIKTYDVLSNVTLYKDKDCWVCIYDTLLNYDTNFKWDAIRNELLHIIHTYKFITIKKDTFLYDYYINVDCDDFLYTKTPDYNLENNINTYHCIEYLPTYTKFDHKKDLEFFNCGYYFELKAQGKDLVKHQHDACRNLDYKSWLKSTHHKFENLHLEYEECKNFNKDDPDNCCFAFGCCDLDYFLTQKHWIQTIKVDVGIAMDHIVSNDQKKKEFEKYYHKNSLTQKELEDVGIVNTGLFKDL